jgi:hypothetical protein
MTTLKFQNTEYKIRKIETLELGNVLISTINLNTALLNNGSAYVSKEAQRIDEEIYFFVEDNEMDLQDTELINLIKLHTI